MKAPIHIRWFVLYRGNHHTANGTISKMYFTDMLWQVVQSHFSRVYVMIYLEFLIYGSRPIPRLW